MTDIPAWFHKMVASTTPNTVWGGTHKHIAFQLGEDPTSHLILAFGDFGNLKKLGFKSLTGTTDPRAATYHGALKFEFIKARKEAGPYDLYREWLFMDSSTHENLQNRVARYVTHWNKKAGTTRFVLSDVASEVVLDSTRSDASDIVRGINLTMARAIKTAFDQINEANVRHTDNLHRVWYGPQYDARPIKASETTHSHLEVVMLCQRQTPRYGLGFNDNNFQATTPLIREVLGIKPPEKPIANLTDLQNHFKSNRIG